MCFTIRPRSMKENSMSQILSLWGPPGEIRSNFGKENAIPETCSASLTRPMNNRVSTLSKKDIGISIFKKLTHLIMNDS